MAAQRTALGRSGTRDLGSGKKRRTARGGASEGEANAAIAASKLDPGIYVVATPIGNLGDVSARARKVLGEVDLVLCEDSRVTGRLLAHLGSDRPLLAYHDHSAERLRPQILERAKAGESLALVSDAGTPCLADPGHKLVREAREAGIPVRAVPGASSITAALSIAGLPTDRFFFQGFLPAKAGERRKVLAEIGDIPGTLVILESPARLADMLEDCAEILGTRPAAIARELTKLYEEVRSGTLDELAAAARSGPSPRGEHVVLVGASVEPEGERMDDAAVDQALRSALLEHKPGRAAAIVAEISGRPRDALYKRALALPR